jgi:1-deoxy-D-xylulose-5-phosphate reductoisomerase
MVEFRDGSVKAQLGCPDMRLPIQYALGYPERLPQRYTAMDWSAAGPLTFGPVDLERFPCLRLAREAGAAGGTYTAVLAAADEVAVELFLGRRLGFMDIPRLIEGALGAHRPAGRLELGTIRAADVWARRWVLQQVDQSPSGEPSPWLAER